MAESNSFYESPNLDLSGPGGSNQQSQLDQEDKEYDNLLGQFSADGVITEEERAILSGVSNGQGVQTQEPATPATPENAFFSPGGFGYEYLGGRLGENIGQFAGEQKYGTGITAEGQATGFPVDRPSLAGDLLTIPGTALNVVGDFVTDPFIAGGELAKDAASYVTGASGVQAQQAAQFAQDLEAVSNIDPFTGQTIENPTPFDFNNDPSAGMAMNQQAIADALAGTNAQSQEEGQVRAAPPAQTLSQYLRYEDSPEQRTEQFVDEQGRLRLRPTPEAAQLRGLSDFVQPPLDEREMRLAERDRLPGETQTGRDTRIAQSRTTGARTEDMSFDDAKRRAEGELVQRGVRNPSSSQVNALAGLIRAQEPERLEALRIKRAKDLAKLNFEPKVVEVEGQKLIQLAPEYYQPVRAEPKGDEPFEPRILDHNNFIYFEIAPNRFERQPSDGQTRDDIIDLIKQRQAEEAMGATPAEGSNASDVKSYATEAEAKASGAKGEVIIGGRRAIIE